MTDSRTPNRLAALQARPKTSKTAADAEARQAEQIGEGLGFVGRGHRRKPGRKPSPRIYTIHPKLLPKVGAELMAEATARGMSMGMLIEAL